MPTINISDETKSRFRILKIKESAEKEKSISEDEFLKILLDKFENKSKGGKNGKKSVA